MAARLSQILSVRRICAAQKGTHNSPGYSHPDYCTDYNPLGIDCSRLVGLRTEGSPRSLLADWGSSSAGTQPVDIQLRRIVGSSARAGKTVRLAGNLLLQGGSPLLVEDCSGSFAGSAARDCRPARQGRLPKSSSPTCLLVCSLLSFKKVCVEGVEGVDRCPRVWKCGAEYYRFYRGVVGAA